MTQIWTSSIQLIICLVLLLINLGPSALAGFGLLVIVSPLQTVVLKRLFAWRARSMLWTDKRARLLQELLGGIKVIKFFAWEIPFLQRIYDYRRKEMSFICTILLVRSAMSAISMSMPVLASVLAFVTYSATGHPLNAADIFASLTLFNLLRPHLSHIRACYIPWLKLPTYDSVQRFRWVPLQMQQTLSKGFMEFSKRNYRKRRS